MTTAVLLVAGAALWFLVYRWTRVRDLRRDDGVWRCKVGSIECTVECRYVRTGMESWGNMWFAIDNATGCEVCDVDEEVRLAIRDRERAAWVAARKPGPTCE